MDTRYLSIAGFIIAVEFEEPEIKKAKEQYIRSFIKVHKDFVIEYRKLKLEEKDKDAF